MKRALAIAAIVVGVICLILAYIYWTTPASGLPAFFPGYDPTMAGIHFKHGLAALILAILLFIYAWFATGKKNRAQKP
jgi:hypothetical protein